jgi:hypothetical protein
VVGSETEQVWNAGRRLLAAVMTEDELILIDLELSSADAVVGAVQPLLEVAHGSIGQGHSGFRALTEFGSQGLKAREVFETSFRKTLWRVEAPLYTIYWGLLKQPDKQKPTRED